MTSEAKQRRAVQFHVISLNSHREFDLIAHVFLDELMTSTHNPTRGKASQNLGANDGISFLVQRPQHQTSRTQRDYLPVLQISPGLLTDLHPSHRISREAFPFLRQVECTQLGNSFLYSSKVYSVLLDPSVYFHEPTFFIRNHSGQINEIGNAITVFLSTRNPFLIFSLICKFRQQHALLTGLNFIQEIQLTSI